MVPESFLIIEKTDYSSGDHSAHFRFETLGPLVIVAARGSTIGTRETEALLVMDRPANYRDDRFLYLSAPRACTPRLVPLPDPWYRYLRSAPSWCISSSWRCAKGRRCEESTSLWACVH